VTTPHHISNSPTPKGQSWRYRQQILPKQIMKDTENTIDLAMWLHEKNLWLFTGIF